MPPRAPALPPDQRRAALVQAALPLVVQRGLDVTTKDIATAAGVAEGTIFRVFDSKDELLLATARCAFDTAVLESELGQIRLDTPLDLRLMQIIEVNQRAAQRIMAVLAAFGRPCDRDRLGNVHDLLDSAGQARATARAVDLLTPDADRLRKPVSAVVAMIGVLTWSSVHPMSPGHGLSATDLADLVLHGMLNPKECSCSGD